MPEHSITHLYYIATVAGRSGMHLALFGPMPAMVSHARASECERHNLASKRMMTCRIDGVTLPPPTCALIATNDLARPHARRARGIGPAPMLTSQLDYAIDSACPYRHARKPKLIPPGKHGPTERRFADRPSPLSSRPTVRRASPCYAVSSGTDTLLRALLVRTRTALVNSARTVCT